MNKGKNGGNSRPCLNPPSVYHTASTLKTMVNEVDKTATQDTGSPTSPDDLASTSETQVVEQVMVMDAEPLNQDLELGRNNAGKSQKRKKARRTLTSCVK